MGKPAVSIRIINRRGVWHWEASRGGIYQSGQARRWREMWDQIYALEFPEMGEIIEATRQDNPTVHNTSMTIQPGNKQ